MLEIVAVPAGPTLLAPSLGPTDLQPLRAGLCPSRYYSQSRWVFKTQSLSKYRRTNCSCPVSFLNTIASINPASQRRTDPEQLHVDGSIAQLQSLRPDLGPESTWDVENYCSGLQYSYVEIAFVCAISRGVAVLVYSTQALVKAHDQS